MNEKTRPRAALTHRFLTSLKPEATAFRVPDERCAGLAVRVATSGVISFDLAYRISKSKKFRRISLGKFPDVSLDEARKRAHELTQAARAGRDKVDEERREKLAREDRLNVRSLVKEYVKRRVVGRLRTAVEIEARLNRALAAVLDQRADELRRRDLRRLLERAADAGYVREAEQRRVCLNGMFKWAVANDHLEQNPMIGLASFGRSPPRKRILSSAEIRTLWLWLAESEMPSQPADVLRLQLCLGARCTEVGGMHFGEFDTRSWLWTLPAERSKNKKPRVTPIVGLARDIISGRLTACSGDRLFLTDTGQWLKSMHLGHFLLNHRPPIEKFGTHDLRRTVATEMAEALHIGLETIARVIGHSAGGASVQTLVAHYVSAEFLSDKTVALEAWDRRLRSIIAGEVEEPRVLPFEPPRRSSVGAK